MNSETSVSAVETDRVLHLVALSAKRIVRKHYVLSSMYVLGLLVAALATGYHVDSQSAEVYEEKMNHASHVTSTEILHIIDQVKRADNLYYQSKGWFSCDEVCTKHYERLQLLKEQLAMIKDKRDSLQSEAKRTVGAWSVYGIADLRKGFWAAWEQGKEAAKRMTMFDAVFIGLGAVSGTSDSRDNSFLWALFQIVVQFLVNLTIGLFTSLVVFLVEAWYIITSYGPSIFSAPALFLLVVCAASAVMATAVGGVFGGLAGGVYLLVRSAEKKARLEARRTGVTRRLHWE